MTTAGAPCCGDPKRSDAGTRPLALPEGGTFPGEGPNLLLADGGVSAERCNAVCGPPDASTDSFECRLVSSTDVECTFVYDVCNQPGGRKPSRFVARRSRGATREGAWLAAMAQLEAASVFAFETLRDDLARLGAPADLRRAAEAAIRDEERHAALVGALARYRGAEPCAPRRREARPRSLRAIARENAVEGCVRETFGALVAWHQALHAKDADVRTVMREVAADETRHAALAFGVDAWAKAKLGPRDVAAIRRSERDARRTLDLRAPRGIARSLGLPAARDARRLVSSLFRALA